jgi:tRNA threonylcarbamoyladenosine biosynthesis protein TsaB
MPDRARSLLALDAAGAACSAAVWRDGAIAAQSFELMTRGQAERLVPMIQEVMDQAGLGYEALDAIAVTRGPGGFTGVRIGLATARALALACGKPLIGLSNFEAVAAAVPDDEREYGTLAVLIGAKRREVYAQAFSRDLAPLTEAGLFAPEALDGALPGGPFVLAGDAAPQAAPVLRAAGRELRLASSPGHADAAFVAELAACRPLPGADASPPQPIYLRAPDVTLPGAQVPAEAEQNS